MIEKAEFRWESKSTWELGLLRFEENANTLSYMTLYRDNQCFDLYTDRESMLQLGVCKTGNRLGTPPEPPQAGAYISQDTPEHPPTGRTPLGTPLITKIRPKKLQNQKKNLKKTSMNQ